MAQDTIDANSTDCIQRRVTAATASAARKVPVTAADTD
jgi:hypothetical protein